MAAAGLGLEAVTGGRPRSIARAAAPVDRDRESTGQDVAAPPTDAELVARARHGDGEAFGRLYDRYLDAVYGYVLAHVLDRSVAEDLTQDVFVAALEALPRFHWRGSLAPWLMRIARNRLANHWRSLGRRPPTSTLPDDEPPADHRGTTADALGTSAERSTDPVSFVERRLLLDDLADGLASLTDLEREVLALRVGLDWPLADVARYLGRSKAAICSLQYRALRRLSRHVRREGDTP